MEDKDVRLLKRYIHSVVSESIQQLLDENKVITFSGDKVYPRFGWCVILSGGTGSGKGFVINKQLPIDGKVMNVDHYNKLYFQGVTRKKINDPRVYDMSNGADVEAIHGKVKERGWKGIERENFFNGCKNTNDRLPNVIFDITGKSISDIEEILHYVKPLGYKVMFIWAVANRSMAMFRNLSRRKRVVPQNILHSIHNACNDFIPKFLKGGYGADVISQIDDAWLAFGSGDNLQQNEIENPCVKLTKVNGAFEFPNGTEELLWKILGPKEEDAQSPKTYLSNDDAFAKMYPVVVKVNGKDKIKYKTNELDFLRH